MSKMDTVIRKLKHQYQIAPITMSLISICIVVYVISFLLFGEEMNVYEGLAFGGYNPLYVHYMKEYYRLLTANFIHFGLLHLVINCYSLYGLGMFIENSLKSKKYLILLFVSALATTGLPYILYLWNGFGAQSLSGGISGVIFGLIGSLMALALRYRHIYMDIFRQLAPNVILMLGISFVIPSISLSGHISGLIGGFICTWLLLYQKRQNDHQDHFIH